MYSLYRAWLLRESSPPDVVICVGAGAQTHQFAGHRVVLSAHSGYLKSMLADESDRRQLLVPNVSAEVFAPLLTFMYTGYLDLTPDNIYGVLLATHLLHMPRALDLCRSYLLQHQPQPPPTLVKPIPSRKLLPVLFPPPPPTGVYWPPPPPPYQPLPALPDDYRSVFPITMPETVGSEQQQEAPPQARSPAIASTSAIAASSTSVAPAVSPSPSQSSDCSNQVTVTVTPGPDSRKQRPTSTTATDSKVIVDVACCDGPVRFHRVLNQNYGRETECSNQDADPEPDSESTSTPDRSGPVFTCRYCDHTFKSHYCYQKHARRHINPVSLTPDTAAPPPTEQPSPPTTTQINHKREVRLLDMNVQYYPCKTCGSKFPSYYFVHKHRKMCHPNEETTSSATAVASGSTDNSRSSCVAPAP